MTNVAPTIFQMHTIEQIKMRVEQLLVTFEIKKFNSIILEPQIKTFEDKYKFKIKITFGATCLNKVPTNDTTLRRFQCAVPFIWLTRNHLQIIWSLKDFLQITVINTWKLYTVQVPW